MPDLGNLLNSTSSTAPQLPIPKFAPPDPCDAASPLFYGNNFKTLAGDELWCHGWGKRMRDGKETRVLGGHPETLDRCKKASGNKGFEDHLRDWVEDKISFGVPRWRCFLPFLVSAPRLVECLVCHKFVYPGEEALCSVRGCDGVYHLKCAKQKLGFTISRKFKCPQHACFICKQRLHWRCTRCTMASHDKCAAWPEKVLSLINRPGTAVCWRHPVDWRLEKKSAAPVSGIEEVFCCLPVPYVEEEFKIDIAWKELTGNNLEPPSYVHIRRNAYLVKKKRDDADDDIGCTSCSSICGDDCVCRVQSISCSKACRCSEICTNRPFRKEKKIKIVKTEFCGWGVEAAESINKGDFIVEYVGEVIDDALCEQRLWDMKYKCIQNFYMCEVRKDFTIDATFKGNSSRFLNHSCNPNCKLEKWQVDGETRVGVFAARSIEVGDPLTYDYRFVQFGTEVKCYCGAVNCQGYLGGKRKISKITVSWGLKRRRTSTACLTVITV